MKTICAFLVIAVSFYASANEITVSQGQLSISLGRSSTAVEINAASLLARRIEQRSGIVVPISSAGSESKYTLHIGRSQTSNAIKKFCSQSDQAEKLKEDGFYINTLGTDLYIVGNNDSGVVAGVGQFVRLCDYFDGSVSLPKLSIVDNPVMPIRGMYFATHFENFYKRASIEQVNQIIEELALWGCNNLALNCASRYWESIDCDAASRHLARINEFAKTAKSFNIDIAILLNASQAYSSHPNEVSAKSAPWVATSGHDICPSNPAGLEIIGKAHSQIINEIKHLDNIVVWPYDYGGCACENCAPYGANGFIKSAKQLSKIAKPKFAECKIWLSTWWFDIAERGEYKALFEYLKQQQPEWLTGLMCGENHSPYQRIFDRPLQDKYPLTWFPEISMYGMRPWGGCGANPLPQRFTEMAAKVKDHAVGGWPYSEGIYEDINKFFWIRTFWNPNQPTEKILAEYAKHYFGSEFQDQAVEMFYMLEKTHHRAGLNIANLEQADEISDIADIIDKNMPNWAKDSWRWRIFYIRSKIDYIVKNEGFNEPEPRAGLQKLLDELAGIYRSSDDTDTDVSLSGVVTKLPAVSTETAVNVALRKPVKTSSTANFSGSSKENLVDGIDTFITNENYWAHDPQKEENAWIEIDLQQIVPIKEVRLQFRNILGKFTYIPQYVGFEVSTDGEDFAAVPVATTEVPELVLHTRDVPVEGNSYSQQYWVYAVPNKARFVRVILGPSQHTASQFEGVLQLTEVMVISEPENQ